METTIAPVRVKPKIGKNVFSCASLALICIASIFLALLFAIAKSGVMHIPVLSSAYRGPQPTRMVQTPALSVDEFKAKIESRFLAQAMSGKKPPYEVEITEQELTGVMETAVNAALRDQGWKRITTQVVIRPSDLEFVGRFQQGIFHVDVLARFRPFLENGGLSFEPVEVRVGDYPVPKSMAYDVLGFIFSRDLGTFFLGFAGARLEQISLQDGRLYLVATTH